ncbi:MAG: DNA translocase FtsK, partial [Bacteroidota bacterium]
LLFVSLIAYLIWQFNPQLKWPVKEEKETADELTETDDLLPDSEETEKEESAVVAPLTTAGMTVNEMYQQQEGPVVVQFPVEEEPVMNMKLIEKEDDEEVPEAVVEISEEPKPIELNPHVSFTLPTGMSSGMQDVLTTGQGIEEDMDPIDNNENELALEIKTVPDPVEEEIIEVAKEELKPYEPTLDLRDYKYPSLDLLEQHGSEKIIQDNNELENNKNQIIATLRNYSIEIQKISATVGPTVTLYEIVPAAGVRISKIKNLEDDIALSLAALGIRIIAPIPGKGTIGIEVPNVKKTVVSMKTLLSSERFQNSSHSLPIAIGKRIDNENFIVDLAAMPHLLMAGATGQGKS